MMTTETEFLDRLILTHEVVWECQRCQRLSGLWHGIGPPQYCDKDSCPLQKYHRKSGLGKATAEELRRTFKEYCEWCGVGSVVCRDTKCKVYGKGSFSVANLGRRLKGNAARAAI
jgi:hypothetical protein